MGMRDAHEPPLRPFDALSLLVVLSLNQKKNTQKTLQHNAD